jgi:hypothetical protein
VIVTGQIEEKPAGSFLLAVTTAHQGDEWTTPQSKLDATTWDEARAEAQLVLARYEAAILGAAD